MLHTVIRYLSAAGILFALWFLARHGTGGLESLVLVSPWKLFLSVTVLVGVFHVRAWMWLHFLRRCGLPIGYRSAVVSRFRPILAKYVPGKIWVVMGAAESITPLAGSFRQSVVLTVCFQFSLILSGLLTGAAGLVVLGFPAFLSQGITVLAGAILGGAGLVLVSSRTMTRAVLKKIAASDARGGAALTVPSMIPTHILGIPQWMATGWAFELFFESLGGHSGGYALFYQPVAQVAGTVFALTPGGLGTREAFMTGYLGLAGMSLGLAGALALAARLWFLGVETILFAIGWFLGATSGTAKQSPARRPDR